MSMQKSMALSVLAALTGLASAQAPDDLPTERVAIIPPGGSVDLDTGVILPRRDGFGMHADLRFDRDGAGFYLEPFAGGVPANTADIEPAAEWQRNRVRIGRNQQQPTVLFVRTDHGVARVQLMVADPYSTASASLRWSVVPPKHPVFLPPPTELAAAWVQDKLSVTWTGDAPLWLVEVHTGDAVRKLTTDKPVILIDELAPTAVHRILVRGVSAQHDVSLPGEVVQSGPRQPPRCGHIDFDARWYDRSGGMKLIDGSIAVEDAEVVFYLYGVSVPGGGVRKLGTGARTFGAIGELPAGPYPPIYGRIDDDDVLAVQLADGRYGKLWLQPKTSDLRDGMRVHYAFLGDGRRQFLTPPTEPTAQLTKGAVTVRWNASPGAARYRLTIPGRAQPLLTDKLELTLGDLQPERFFDAQLVAIGADGEESEATALMLHTYAGGAHIGRFQLHAQQDGFAFANEANVAMADADLVLAGGAGGASSLSFTARHGAAAAGTSAFGDFAAAAQAPFAERFDSDDRRAGSGCFLVRTKEGIAWVRLIERSWPSPRFEYVWLPRHD